MSEVVDQYKTLKGASTGLFKDRGSKFIAYAWPVFSEEDIKARLEEVRKEHHTARHHCYAWSLGVKREPYRANDDGEPSGSAGKPIFGQFLSHDITNAIIVVVRYFGGVKLGVGGLINAYRSAAADAIANGTIVDRKVMSVLMVKFTYARMSDVMRIIKDNELEQSDQQFDLECQLKLMVRQSETKAITTQLTKIEDVDVEFLHLS